jgi:hypothetical protein
VFDFEENELKMSTFNQQLNGLKQQNLSRKRKFRYNDAIDYYFREKPYAMKYVNSSLLNKKVLKKLYRKT